MTPVLVAVRCPTCNRLAAKVSPGAVIQVKCSRCGALFERDVRPAVGEQSTR